MVNIQEETHVRREDGYVEAHLRARFSDNESLNAEDLRLSAIEMVDVTPLEGDFVFGGGSVTRPGSINNSVTMTTYLQAAGTLNAAGSATYYVRAVGQ